MNCFKILFFASLILFVLMIAFFPEVALNDSSHHLEVSKLIMQGQNFQGFWLKNYYTAWFHSITGLPLLSFSWLSNLIIVLIFLFFGFLLLRKHSKNFYFSACFITCSIIFLQYFSLNYQDNLLAMLSAIFLFFLDKSFENKNYSLALPVIAVLCLFTKKIALLYFPFFMLCFLLFYSWKYRLIIAGLLGLIAVRIYFWLHFDKVVMPYIMALLSLNNFSLNAFLNNSLLYWGFLSFNEVYSRISFSIAFLLFLILASFLFYVVKYWVEKVKFKPDFKNLVLFFLFLAFGFNLFSFLLSFPVLPRTFAAGLLPLALMFSFINSSKRFKALALIVFITSLLFVSCSIVYFNNSRQLLLEGFEFAGKLPKESLVFSENNQRELAYVFDLNTNWSNCWLDSCRSFWDFNYAFTTCYKDKLWKVLDNNAFWRIIYRDSCVEVFEKRV